MAAPFAKRQRDLAKKQRKEEKRQRKAATQAAEKSPAEPPAGTGPEDRGVTPSQSDSAR